MFRLVLLGLVAALLAWSAWEPFDRMTWWLEVSPVLAGATVLILTARRFPLTPLAYVLISLHATVLIMGSHWSYARVPLGEWAQELMGLDRNPYDRLGHFCQGFVPAVLARELLLRTSPLRKGFWLAALTFACCMAVSALYELFEWVVAMMAGGDSKAFLGTQGDDWDTQWDMFLAAVGSILSMLLLSRFHDRQIERLPAPSQRH